MSVADLVSAPWVEHRLGIGSPVRKILDRLGIIHPIRVSDRSELLYSRSDVDRLAGGGYAGPGMAAVSTDTSVDPDVKWTTGRIRAGDHVLRTYADGTWSLWHPAECSSTDISFHLLTVHTCPFTIAARRDLVECAVTSGPLVVELDPGTHRIRHNGYARWEDIVAGEVTASDELATGGLS